MTTEIANTVTQYFAQIKTLEQEKKDKTADLYSQIKIIEKDMNSKVYAVENALDKIKDKYTEFALELAIEANDCPRSRWGSYLDPSETYIKEDGIHLTWIQENPYGRDNYDYFTATWEDLLEYEAKQQPVEIIEVKI